jgi:hypothetical protein
VPTKRKRHAITETEPVEAALDELRELTGSHRLDLGELVVIGANAKVAELTRANDDALAARKRLADRVRRREILVDIEVADEVRQTGWARELES